MYRNFTQLVSLLALLNLIHLPVATAQYEGTWHKAIDKNNIDVKIYRSPDLRVRGFKAETTIYMPFDSLEAVFDRIEKYPEWQPTVKEAKKVYQRSSQNYHVFTKERLAWPSKERDFMWAVNKQWDDHQQALIYDLVCSSNTLPEKGNHGTVMQAFITWWLQPISEDEIKVIYYMTVDRGGKLPTWMISMMNPDLPFKTLENLRAQGYASDVLSALD